MLEQLDVLRNQVIPEAELRKAKEYLKGHMLLRMEDTLPTHNGLGSRKCSTYQCSQ